MCTLFSGLFIPTRGSYLYEKFCQKVSCCRTNYYFFFQLFKVAKFIINGLNCVLIAMLKIEMIGNITNFITSHRLDCYYTLKIVCIFVRMHIFLCRSYAVFSIFIAYFYFLKKGKLRASPFCHFRHLYIQFLVIFIGGFDLNLFVHKIYLVLVLVSMKIVTNFDNNIFCKNTHVLQIFFGVHILKRFVMRDTSAYFLVLLFTFSFW